MTGIFKLYFIYCYNAGIITVLGGGGVKIGHPAPIWHSLITNLDALKKLLDKVYKPTQHTLKIKTI